MSDVHAFILRRNWLLPSSLLMVGLFAFSVVLSGRIEAFPATLAAVGWAVVIVARNGFEHRSATVVSVTATSVAIGSDLVLPLATLSEVRRVAYGDRDALVRLGAETPRRRVTLRLAVHDADALVAAIGPRRASFPLILPPFTRVASAFLFFTALGTCLLVVLVLTGLDIMGVVRCAFSLLPASVVLSLIASVPLGFVRGEVVLGLDGFTLRWPARERFVAYGDIVKVTETPGFAQAVEVRVDVAASRRPIELVVRETPSVRRERGAESRAMLLALRSALADARARATSVDLAAGIRKQGRSPRAWLEGVAAALHGSYRVAGMGHETLASLVGNPAVTRDARVGAAAALLRVGTEDGRARVRVAAEACAESELREVLLALAEAEDDQAVESALARLHA